MKNYLKIIPFLLLLCSCAAQVPSIREMVKIDCADKLAKALEESSNQYRTQIGDAKRNLVIGGGAATAVGLIGASLTQTQKKDDDKAKVGAGTAILSAFVGLYQVWQGFKADPTNYVRESAVLATDYTKNKLIAQNEANAEVKAELEEARKLGKEFDEKEHMREKINAKMKPSIINLFDGAKKLKENYPEYARFNLTNICD